MMRIITGSAKGVRLSTLEGEATRPTSERVKEAVFSMLQFDIEGRAVLDLFSGSGQMSLEALSRGASSAVMCDKSKDAIKIIRSNAEKTRLSDQCTIYNCDYREYINKSRGKKFDIIFIDPPYAQKLCSAVLSELRAADMLKSSSIIVCESEEEDIFAGNGECAAHFEVVKKAKYSKSYITILRALGE